MKDRNEDIERRAARRKRRVRNQIIAYMFMVIIVVIVVMGIIFGISKLIKWVQSGKQHAEQLIQEQQEEAKEQQNEMDEMNSSKEEEESGQTETVPEEDSEEVLSEMVDGFIQDMTAEEKAAAVFLVSPEAITDVDVVVQAGDGTKAALEQYAVGGLIYQSKNIQNAEQIQQMITNTSYYSKYPMFYAVSEEAGRGTLMGISALGLEQTDTAQKLAEAGDNNAVYQAYSTIGSYMSSFGFNVNFAPVADVLTNSANSELQGRTFGSDAQSAKEMVAFATDALEKKGVSAVLMKFPGEGDIETGEGGVSVTNKTLSELKASELITFETGIDAGADFVMVSHICAPSITGDTLPSSLSSKMIQEVLREDLKFDGIVITDAMNKSVITDQYSAKEAAVMALNAGADMILQPQNFKEAYQGVLEALQDGTISEERINNAIHHIFMVKYKDVLDEEG